MFVFQKIELRVRKLLAAKIRQQPVRAPGDMPQMKADRAEAVGRRPDLLRREPFGEFLEILASLLETIERRRDQRMHALYRAAHPRFRECRHSFIKPLPRGRGSVTEDC